MKRLLRSLRIPSSLLVIGTVLLMGQAAAQPAPVGRVDSLVGQAAVQRAGDSVPQPLVLQTPVFEGDVVRTANASRVQLAFRDDTLLVLSANTEIRIAGYMIRDGSERNVLVSLTQGFLRTVVRRLFPSSRFDVNSGVAVASVRATEWIEQAQEGRTDLVVLDGRVAVASTQGRGEVEVGPGQGTTVTSGQAPTPPSTWGEARRNDFIDRTTIR